MSQRTIKAPAIEGSITVGSIVQVVSELEGRPSSERAPRAAAKKRTPNAAFMKAMTPSATLAAIIGDKPMPRTEVTKKVWEYIKRNKLQDSVNIKTINADAKLRSVFKKAQVSMFEMTKLINAHLK